MLKVVAALIVSDSRILICQRTKYQSMPLRWEFPGGKIELGEQPDEALRRELNEELGIDATIGDEVAHLVHRYSATGSIDLRFFVVREFAGDLQNRIFHDIRWTPRTDLPRYNFLDADTRLIHDIAAGKLY